MEGSAEKPAAAVLGTASQEGDKDLTTMGIRHHSNPLRPVSEPISSMQTSFQAKEEEEEEEEEGEEGGGEGERQPFLSSQRDRNSSLTPIVQTR